MSRDLCVRRVRAGEGETRRRDREREERAGAERKQGRLHLCFLPRVRERESHRETPSSTPRLAPNGSQSRLSHPPPPPSPLQPRATPTLPRACCTALDPLPIEKRTSKGERAAVLGKRRGNWRVEGERACDNAATDDKDFAFCSSLSRARAFPRFTVGAQAWSEKRETGATVRHPKRDSFPLPVARREKRGKERRGFFLSSSAKWEERDEPSSSPRLLRPRPPPPPLLLLSFFPFLFLSLSEKGGGESLLYPPFYTTRAPLGFFGM